MKRTKLLAALMLLTAVILIGAARAKAAAVARLNPDGVNLSMDISSLSVEDLRLLRSAIYARHCYWFEDGHLRSEFREYQEKKCGAAFYQQKPKTAFDPAVLTAAEQAFAARVKAREDELRQGQVRVAGGAPVYDRRAIVNLSQFSTAPKPVLDRLLAAGFVVVPARHEQLFQVYEENGYRVIPNFITVDSVLQLYHLYFDFTLRELEADRLLPAAAALSHGMVEKLRARYSKARGTPAAEPIKRALLFFAVAEDLTLANPGEDQPEGTAAEEVPAPGPIPLVSAADYARPATAWMEASWKKDFLAQRKLILTANQKIKGPIMGTVDYSLFIPRGHYTRSRKLARYFRAMMWLSLPGFILDGKTMPIESPLVVVYDLTHSPELMAKYEIIADPTSFYVGPSDDVTPALLRKVADEICGPGAGLDQWFAKREAIRLETVKRDPARIHTAFGDDRDLPKLLVMGQRYIPDSEVLQRLTDTESRPVPSGLDVFGVMGAPIALEILQAAKIPWPGYWTELKKLQAELRDLPPAGTESNLYWRWLHLLRTLNQSAPAGAAPFMATKPWQAKTLNSALASWAELRHDTILYAKAAGAECDGGEPPPRVVGYVEARPDVFAELLELQQYTDKRLQQRGLITDRLAEAGAELEDMFAFLHKVSAKEVAGQALTDAEYAEIRIFGGRIENLTIKLLTADDYLTWFEVSGPDRFLAVVADVGTFRGQALEEGVGYADELYALVVINGYLYVTRGPVFSYYEFTRPAAQRLSDETWQGMLRQGRAPARPAFSESFFVNQPVPALPERYIYSSGG